MVRMNAPDSILNLAAFSKSHQEMLPAGKLLTLPTE